MRTPLKTFTLIAAILSSVAAHSVGQGDTRDAELALANKELNEVYSVLLRRLPTTEYSKLKSAQRAWMQMRELDCRWAFVDKRDCLIDRTANRTRELRETLFQAADGKYESIRDGAR